MSEAHDGWTNWETWAIGTFLQNDENIYDQMVLFINSYHGEEPYLDFIKSCELLKDIDTIPEGVSLTDPIVNVQELNEMMDELVFDYDAYGVDTYI